MVDTNARRQERIWLLHLFLAALVFRAALVALPRVIRWDEPDYLRLGQSLLTGQGYTINGVPELHYTPLYPILAGAVYTLTGSAELGSDIWFVLLGAALTLPVFALGRRVGGRRAGLLAALLVAFFPATSSAVLYWGTMTEPLFMLLVYCALWAAALAFESERWLYLALSGGLMCMAYLARPEGLVYAALLPAYVVVVSLSRKRPAHLLARDIAAYAVAFALVATPYALYVHQQSGRWMATGKLAITYDIGEAVLTRNPVLYDKVTASLDPESGEILWWSETRFDKSLLDVLLEDPTAFFVRIWRNVPQMTAAVFAGTIFPLFLLGPVLLAWFQRPWLRQRFLYEGLLWVGVLPVLSFLVFHVEVRFFAPALPAMLIWVACGLWALSQWFAETLDNWGLADAYEPRRSRWRSVGQFAAATCLLVFAGMMHIRVIEQGSSDLAYAHKQVGQWLSQNSPEDAAVMSRDLAISVYAERGFVASPRAGYRDYIDYARRHGATHIVVDEQELRAIRPHLAFLLDDANPPPELERVYGASDQKGRTIVYRLRAES